jgi:hypothetical protein
MKIRYYRNLWINIAIFAKYSTNEFVFVLFNNTLLLVYNYQVLSFVEITLSRSFVCYC